MRIPLFILCLACGASAGASTRTVAPDGSGEYPTIQAAVDAALDGDTIELLDGVFLGVGNRDVRLAGKAIIVQSQSNDAAVCTINCEGTEAEPHRAFLFDAGETAQTALSGLTIIGGHTASEESGGAIYVLGASPTIRRSVFRNNTSRTHGGAVYVEDGSPRLEECQFIENTARLSGGGFNELSELKAARSVLDRCVFVGNQALSGGGAQAGFAQFQGCEFRANRAAASGGAIRLHTPGAQSEIRDCLVVGNTAGDGGGGINVSLVDVVIRTCTLSGNTANDGGGLYVSEFADVAAETCILFGNCATSRGDELFTSFEGTAILDCCLIDPTGTEGDGQVTFGQDIVSEDPRFCARALCTSAPTAEGDYTLEAGSICLAERSPCGEQIGALGQGCPSTPAEASSWGRIKALYKGD